MECGHQNIRFDPYWTLTLPMPADTNVRSAVVPAAVLARQSVSRLALTPPPLQSLSFLSWFRLN